MAGLEGEVGSEHSKRPHNMKTGYTWLSATCPLPLLVRVAFRLQTNHTDCGLFLLAYIEFFTAANPKVVVVNGCDAKGAGKGCSVSHTSSVVMSASPASP